MNVDRYLDAEWKDDHMGRQYLHAYRNDGISLKDTPMLMVGIGGSGIDALLTLKAKLESVYHSEKLSKIEYLFIDTDEMPRNAGIKKNDKVILQSADTAILLRERDSLSSILPDEIKEWLHDGIEPLRIMNGAAGIRQAGRLILFLNIQHIYNVLSRKIKRINTEIEAAKSRVPVYIFTGIGGGTGSGMFVDISYLIRHISKNAEMNGVVFMPDVSCMKPGIRNVTKRNIKKNGGAALRELEYLMMMERYRERFEQRYPGEVGLVSETAPIYDYCYLVGARTKNRKDIRSEKEIYQRTAEFVLQEIQEKYTASHSVGSQKSNLVHNRNRKNSFYENYLSLGADAKYIPIDYYYSWWLKDVFDNVVIDIENADSSSLDEIITANFNKWVEDIYNKNKNNLVVKRREIKDATLNNVREKLEKNFILDKMQGNSILQEKDLMKFFLFNMINEELNQTNLEYDYIKDVLNKKAKKYKFLKRKIAMCYIQGFDNVFKTELELLKSDCKSLWEIIKKLQCRCRKYEGLMQEDIFLFKKEDFEKVRSQEIYNNSLKLASDHIIKDLGQHRNRWVGRLSEHDKYIWLSEYVAELLWDEFQSSECTSLTGLLNSCFDDGSQMKKIHFNHILDSLKEAEVLWPQQSNVKADDAYERIAVAEDANLECWAEDWALSQKEDTVVVRSNILERFAKIIFESGNALHTFDEMNEIETEYLKNKDEAGLHIYGKAPKDWSKLPPPYDDRKWECSDPTVSEKEKDENNQYRELFTNALKNKKIVFDNDQYCFYIKSQNGSKVVTTIGDGDKVAIGDISLRQSGLPDAEYKELAEDMFIRMFSIRDLFK